MAKTLMTPKAAAKIQSATAKANGGSVPKGSFAARAQRAAAKNFPSANTQSCKSTGTSLKMPNITSGRF